MFDGASADYVGFVLSTVRFVRLSWLCCPPPCPCRGGCRSFLHTGVSCGAVSFVHIFVFTAASSSGSHVSNLFLLSTPWSYITYINVFVRVAHGTCGVVVVRRGIPGHRWSLVFMSSLSAMPSFPNEGGRVRCPFFCFEVSPLHCGLRRMVYRLPSTPTLCGSVELLRVSVSIIPPLMRPFFLFH